MNSFFSLELYLLQFSAHAILTRFHYIWTIYSLGSVLISSFIFFFSIWSLLKNKKCSISLFTFPSDKKGCRLALTPSVNPRICFYLQEQSYGTSEVLLGLGNQFLLLLMDLPPSILLYRKEISWVCSTNGLQQGKLDLSLI